MATQGEAVAHADLVGGGQTTLHSHAGGNGAEIKAGTVTTSGGTATVSFNTAFADANYAIALAAATGADANIANWTSKTASEFTVETQTDKGLTIDVEVLWIATPYADP